MQVGRPTERLLRLRCPICDELISVSVRGLAASVTEDEWLAQLDDDDRLYLHGAHGNTPVVSSRQRTRRLTP